LRQCQERALAQYGRILRLRVLGAGYVARFARNLQTRINYDPEADISGFKNEGNIVGKHSILGATIIAIFVFGAASVYAEILPRSGVFVYSSECYQAEGGDAGGGTFKLTRSVTGDKLEVGGAWEGPMEAFAATNVRLVPSKSKSFSMITYTLRLPWEEKGHTYTGTISTSQIRIKNAQRQR
jgi:hypothetical protein